MNLHAVARALTTDPTASMGELAAAAGVSRATLHRRFASRDELLARLATDAADAALAALAEVDAAPPRPGEVQLRDLVTALTRLGDDYAFLLAAPPEVDALPGVRAAEDAIHGALLTAIAAGRRAGTVRVDAPAPFQARLALATTLATWESVQAGDLGANEAPRVAADAVAGALTPPREPA